jgi:hypothetical protein
MRSFFTHSLFGNLPYLEFSKFWVILANLGKFSFGRVLGVLGHYYLLGAGLGFWGNIQAGGFISFSGNSSH